MPQLNRLVIVQARMTSTRLPGKVMLSLGGRTLLERLMERLERATEPDGIVVATATDATEDPIAELCESQGWHCFRGHPTDLLDRHYQCAREYGAGLVAKVPSDVPVIDPELVDQAFQLFDGGIFDYVGNLYPPSFPDGLDVEVFSMDALSTAWSEAVEAHEREHTTPFLWDNPGRFLLGGFTTPNGVDYSQTHRWTIDYAEDYEFLRRVYQDFYPRAPEFSWTDLVTFLDGRPDISNINKACRGITWHRHHLDDLKYPPLQLVSHAAAAENYR